MEFTNTNEDLGTWIRHHRVTWEMAPWLEMVDHTPASIGFELRLFARHEQHDHPSPGCGLCLGLYQRLRQVAQAALPREHRPTQYQIDPYDASFHLRPEAEWSPEVQLAIHIVHREGYLRPVDDCEKKCAEEIRSNLGRLGVQARTWSEARAQALGSPGPVSSPTERTMKGEAS